MSAVGAATRWPADRDLVGRSGELGRLIVELELVRSERPRVVTVEGARGMGKTALVRHFISRLTDLDVLDASGDEWESRLPYGVVGQLMAPVAALEDLRGLGQAGGPVADPLTVGAQLLTVVGRLAANRPLAIVIDDAHWADSASVQALSFALRRLRFDAVLAVFVGRDDAPGLPDGFRRLSSERGIHVAVGGLDAGELAELAALATGSKLSHRAATRLVELSGGNPLYAVDLLDEVGSDRLEALGSVLPAPRSFAKMVISRLAGCSPFSRRLVEAASVLGPASPLGLAAKLGELTNPLVALDEAVAARLLITGPGVPVQVEFTHPLTRAAVYHHLGAARRADLHARAALLVAPAQTLGHRVAATVGDDAILAGELETRARLEAGQGALAVAAGHLLDAARFCPARADHERMTLDAVELLLGAGDVAEAARAACGIDQFAETARRDYLRGHLAPFMGSQAEAEARLSVAWDRCDPTTEKALRSLISVDMAQLCGAQMRVAEAAHWARRAIETSDLATVTAAAIGVLVPCLGMTGRSADALALLPPFTAERSDAPLDLEVLLARGTVRLWVDDLVGAREDLATVVGRGRDRPAARSALIALGALAHVEYRLGAWDDSVTHATQAVSLADDSDERWMAAFLNSTATWVLAPRGDWDRAEAHAAAARDAARSLGDPMSVFCAAAGSAQVAFFKGEHRRVADTLQPP